MSVKTINTSYKVLKQIFYKKNLIRKDKYFPYKLLTPELLQRLRSVIIRNVRPSALEGGGEPGAAAVEETEPPAWQPPHQLALHDQSQVGPGLLTEWSTLIGREGRDPALIGRELYRTEIFS